MLFKFFMKPSLMWVFHMNAGLACERLEFTLWPQLTAWTTVTRYVVAYMSDIRLLIVSWSIAQCWASWANVLCFAQLLTSGVAPIVFTSTYVYVGAQFLNECSISSNTHCSYDKSSEDASVLATITMVHGHTKVAAVPIDGFKQSTSPRGVDNK